MAATSLLSRPLDLVYFIYFVTHIPVTFLIDFQVFYPASIVPQVLKDALAMFVNDFKDPLMGADPPHYWFLSFVYCELFFQFIFFFVACHGLWKDSTRCRIGLCIYASHVATTVNASLFEVFLNPAYALTSTERYTLASFYLPYLILPLIMLVDSYFRLSKALSHTQSKKVD
ncbi:transmembrane protein 6/97 [Absidia repens]|uniref:Efficient mitochondria targeting-associated protein 19 n=1 Tax=Absidia repens TaxID=90262 RepID=A0A1X2IW32_9FUNG|nr:transmembrane protein 6/97 [Absidia repens]